MDAITVSNVNAIALGTYNERNLKRDISLFIAHLAQKGRRETTQRTYREALKSIFAIVEAEQGRLIDPRDMIPADFELLRQQMTVCDSSKKLYLVVLGRFIEFLTGENPRKKADLLWNDDDKRRLFISPIEFKVMMQDSTPEERLILTLGAYMGLRRSEIAGIRLEDIENGHLMVYGKGHGPKGKRARLFIPPQVRQAIDGYARTRSQIVSMSGSTDTHLLLRDTRFGQGRAMDSAYIGAVVKRISKRNGVEMTPHSLRRLFATSMWQAGTDRNTIRIMMRHSNVNTTLSCYINVSDVSLEDARNRLASVLD